LPRRKQQENEKDYVEETATNAKVANPDQQEYWELTETILSLTGCSAVRCKPVPHMTTLNPHGVEKNFIIIELLLLLL